MRQRNAILTTREADGSKANDAPPTRETRETRPYTNEESTTGCSRNLLATEAHRFLVTPESIVTKGFRGW